MKKLLHILPVLLALCLWVSCKDTKAKSQRIMPVEILADGDLVFRRGTGLLSHVVTSASKDGVYSHIGILKRSATNGLSSTPFPTSLISKEIPTV